MFFWEWRFLLWREIQFSLKNFELCASLRIIFLLYSIKEIPKRHTFIFWIARTLNYMCVPMLHTFINFLFAFFCVFCKPALYFFLFFINKNAVTHTFARHFQVLCYNLQWHFTTQMIKGHTYIWVALVYMYAINCQTMNSNNTDLGPNHLLLWW